MNAKMKSWVVESLECRSLLSVSIGSTLGDVMVSPGAPPSSIDLSSAFIEPATVIVRTSNGEIPIELLSSAAPGTVANFLRYVGAGLYDGTIFHSAVPSFIDEAGGFRTNGSPIPSFGMIANEFGVSNTRGTVAMGKDSGDPNSAASKWFINIGNNASVLDAQDGGFTVFGEVTGNGMAVAAAINALPTIDGSELTSSLSGKPGDPLPVQNASAGISPSNLVVVNNVSFETVPAITVVSDNPVFVSPSVGSDGHTVILTYSPDMKGFAHITVTARDGSGDSVSQRFRVNVGTNGDLLGVTIGKLAAKKVTFRQSNGATVTVSLSGPGTAIVDVAGDSLQESKARNVVVTGSRMALFEIVSHGTTKGSRLNIVTHGKGNVTLGSVTTDSSLGALNAGGITLTGNLNVAGSIASLVLKAINNDGEVSGDAQIAMLSAGNFTVKTTIANATISLTGSGVVMRSLAVGSEMDNVFVNSKGSINSVAVLSMLNSRVFAGVRPLLPNQSLPQLVSDFVINAAILNFRVRRSFSNSTVAAQDLGSISLANTESATSGAIFGLAAHSVASLAAVSAATHRHITGRRITALQTASLLASKLGAAGFAITVV